ncbi:MAG: phosphoribosylformylglycinamidine synthase [Rickettsiales bacterium]|nr:phosphoribosylformylglycinamidine synthase [Rickettsiales bacterium]
MRIRVHVTPRRGVLDPQGQAVAHGLSNLGFSGLGEVRVGKVVDLELTSESDPEAALATARKMASQLLANEVVEDFSVEVLG